MKALRRGSWNFCGNQTLRPGNGLSFETVLGRNPDARDTAETCTLPRARALA